MRHVFYISALVLVSACGIIARKAALRSEAVDDNRAKRIAIFNDTIYPQLRSQCLECHRANIQPVIASDSLEEAYSNVLPFISVDNMPDSILITQTINGHCGRAQCVTDGTDMMRLVVSYLDQVAKLDHDAPPSSTTWC